MNWRSFHLPGRLATLKVDVLMLVRCLLILVITLDLVSSPLHAHHHEGGPEGYAYALHVDHLEPNDADLVDAQNETDELMHVMVDDSPHGGHSVSALRSTPLQGAAIEPASDDWTLVPLITLAVLLGQPVTHELTGWHPRRERVPIPSFRTVPPAGRAPPTLHV